MPIVIPAQVSCDACSKRAIATEQQVRILSLGPPLTVTVDLPKGWATAETEDAQTHVLCPCCVHDQAVQHVLEHITNDGEVAASLADGSLAFVHVNKGDAFVSTGASKDLKFKGSVEDAAKEFVALVGAKAALAVVV
jgi:hypothetical protein